MDDSVLEVEHVPPMATGEPHTEKVGGPLRIGAAPYKDLVFDENTNLWQTKASMETFVEEDIVCIRSQLREMITDGRVDPLINFIDHDTVVLWKRLSGLVDKETKLQKDLHDLNSKLKTAQCYLDQVQKKLDSLKGSE